MAIAMEHITDGQEEFDVKSAAKYLGVEPADIYKLNSAGLLTSTKRLGRLYYTKDVLDAYKERQGEQEGTPQEATPEQEPEVEAEPELLTVKEAATYLGIGTAAIYAATGKGRLHGTKIKDVWHFTKEQLDDYHSGTSPLTLPQEPTTRYAVEREPEVTSESEKMPLCHRCNRQFISTREYTIKKFTDEAGELSWHPVCRDGRCDPQVQNMRLAYQEQLALKREQKRSAKLLKALKDVRTQLDMIIAEYEKE